jgi:hypothetical protein
MDMEAFTTDFEEEDGLHMLSTSVSTSSAYFNSKTKGKRPNLKPYAVSLRKFTTDQDIFPSVD